MYGRTSDHHTVLVQQSKALFDKQKKIQNDSAQKRNQALFDKQKQNAAAYHNRDKSAQKRNQAALDAQRAAFYKRLGSFGIHS